MFLFNWDPGHRTTSETVPRHAREYRGRQRQQALIQTGPAISEMYLPAHATEEGVSRVPRPQAPAVLFFL